jgi:hypothetical protein
LDDLLKELSEAKGNSNELQQQVLDMEKQTFQLTSSLNRAESDLNQAREQMNELEQKVNWALRPTVYMFRPWSRAFSTDLGGIVQVATQVELHQHAQKYCAQLQDYNSKLQCDSQAANESLRLIQVTTLHFFLCRNPQSPTTG